MSRLSKDMSFKVKLMTGRPLLNLKVVTLTVLLVLSLSQALSAARVTNGELIDQLRKTSVSIVKKHQEVAPLLEAIGTRSGIRILVDETIEDDISLDLQDVSLLDLFRLVIDTKGLRYSEKNGVLLVQRAATKKGKQAQIVAISLCPQFKEAADFIIEFDKIKTTEGSVELSANAQCIRIKEQKENIDQIARLFQQLDTPAPQIHLSAQIVAIDKESSENLGITWGNSGKKNLPQDGIIGVANISVFDFPNSIIFGSINDPEMFNTMFGKMKARNQLTILDQPSFVVSDGQVLKLQKVQDSFGPATPNKLQSSSYHDKVSGLAVFPEVVQDKFIRLDIKATEPLPVEKDTDDKEKPVKQKEIRTNLFLEDETTLVVGNVVSREANEGDEDIPWLTEFPLIRSILKNIPEPEMGRELIVFLTPTILKTEDGRSVGGLQVDLMDQQRKISETNRIFSPEPDSEKGNATSTKLLLRPIELHGE